MSQSQPLAWLTEALADLDAHDLRRTRIPHEGMQGPLISVDGRALVNFASNDYLGLAGDKRLVEAAVSACRSAGWGAGSSPLIAGYHSWHARLEAKLADFKGTEAALLCTSGYTANIGAIMALVGPGDAIFSDALNHASLIDGCRLSRADVEVYRHGDCEHLETLLKATRARRKLIVTDSLFSMDGDWAPLEIIAELADRYGCMLMVDEAHATGVFGQRGRGVCETLAVESAVHVRIATLSKALGSIGGVVAGSKPLIEWLVNRARPYIFSTASPSAVAAASMASLEVVDSEPWRRTELLAEASRLREGLRAQEWDVGQSRSQIIPIIVGPSARALELSAKLRAQGYWVPAIRPPSVPVGQARLRISLCYGHSETMVCGLIEALASLR